MRAGSWFTTCFLLAASYGAENLNPLVEAAQNGNKAGVQLALRNHADVNAAQPDGTTALEWAARLDDLEIADILLGAGANAKAANKYGVTPISLAATNGSAAMIERLIRAGADSNSTLPEGETALMTASRTGKLDAVQVLLKHGADVNAKENWRGQTALMWAAAEGHVEVVEALLKAGADMHARAKAPPPPPIDPDDDPAAGAKPAAADNKAATEEKARPENKPPAKRKPRPTDFTPFLFAVRNGHIPVVKALLAAGADPNEALSDGTSALVLAAMNARYELGVVLLDHDARPNADGSGFTALHQVVWTRRPNIHKTPAAVPSGNLDSIGFAKALVAHGGNVNARETKEPDDGNLGKLKRIGATPFLLAAKGADPEMMRVLLSLGADPTLSTNEHITPLEAAAGVGVYRVAESPGTNDEAMECVKIAFEHGGEVNHVDDVGRTAMHGAALRGANNIVQFLYDHGAQLDVVDKKGWTPLIIAEGVFYPDVFKTEVQTAELLRKLGAKEIEVSEAVRYAGMDKDGRESAGGFDTTVGRGSFEAPPMPPKPVTPAGKN
ncbi:MAG: ankyrin repeat domain-containing protein [Bryobacteraceae bacterium]